jgi:hypothetical protein
MLHARKDAAPVTAIESFVNDSADFKINPVPGQNFVIYQTEQFQESALISHIRVGVGSVTLSEQLLFSRETVFVISPCLGFVLRRLLPMPFLVHVASPTRLDFENPVGSLSPLPCRSSATPHRHAHSHHPHTHNNGEFNKDAFWQKAQAEEH